MTPANGWMYYSSRSATVALIVEDGRVVDCPPYVRRWALGTDARATWRRLYRQGGRLIWFSAVDAIQPLDVTAATEADA